MYICLFHLLQLHLVVVTALILTVNSLFLLLNNDLNNPEAWLKTFFSSCATVSIDNKLTYIFILVPIILMYCFHCHCLLWKQERVVNTANYKSRRECLCAITRTSLVLKWCDTEYSALIQRSQIYSNSSQLVFCYIFNIIVENIGLSMTKQRHIFLEIDSNENHIFEFSTFINSIINVSIAHKT